MTREERERRVLTLLADTGLALPPKVIYVNLEMQGATFSERTVHRLLSSLLDRGLVENPPEKDDYYRITGKGGQYLDGELDAGS